MDRLLAVYGAVLTERDGARLSAAGTGVDATATRGEVAV